MRTIKLCHGIGKEGQSHCVMAATSIVAEEPFSSHPKCVCPRITTALIITNDKCPTNAIRERLLGHLPWLIIGTKGNIHHEVKREQLFAEYAKICANTAITITDASADAADVAAADVAAVAAYVAYADTAGADSAAIAAYADAAVAAYVAYAAATAVANTIDTNIVRHKVWEQEMKKFIDFIEEEIIPVYTTMPIEPNYNIERLILHG
jgi:hypothetical protein